MLRGLRSPYYHTDASDLGRFWALAELFDDGIAVSPPDEAPARYHEIHCHLRGGIPYLALWRSFIDSDRRRAVLRDHPCEAGTWQRTWAELVAEAAARMAVLHDGVAHPDPGRDETAYIRALVQHVVNASDVEINEHAVCYLQHAVRYLATCAGLSAFLLHKRGRIGLSPFDASYKRYAKLQKARGSPERQQTRQLVAATLSRFEDEGAVVVELRPTLDRRRCDLQRKLQDVVLGYFDYLGDTVAAGRQPLALGLVPSIFKQEALDKGEPADRDFWREQQEIWVDQVQGLLAILGDSPALRWFVVGLDAAGKERGCPPGVLRPAFDLVRTYNHGRDRARPGRCMSTRFLRELRQNRSSDDALVELDARPVEPIRFGLTVHAGEDFEDPLTGLRHIWEAAVDLDLGEGDRIGHALAAGLDEAAVRTLLERRAGDDRNSEVRLERQSFLVRKPRGTHLLDLAWICRVGEQSEIRNAELRLGEIAARAFGAPANAARLVRELAPAGALPRSVIPGARFADPDHLGSHDLETVVIDESSLALFESLRMRVLRELVRRKLVVESCPTSNLVVANLDQPPLETLAKTARLKVALATDDPGLLGVFPRAEMARFKGEALEAFREKLLEAAAQASFVTRVEDASS